MRHAELHMDKITELLKEKSFLTTEDFYMLYRATEADIKKTTANWRIYHLVEKGIIQRVGRGRYILGKSKPFVPQISTQASKLSKFIKTNFPYINYGIWSIREVNLLSQHLINRNDLFVEVERDVVESVCSKLKDHFKNVITKKSLDHFSDFKDLIVVRPLTTSAPMQVVKGVPTSTIEKLLVDLYSDKEYAFLQGYELIHVYTNAFAQFTINIDKLLRYASRKDRREEIAEFIKTINRQ